MFGISFDELIIIFIIAVILCKPSDLKKIAKYYKKTTRFITNFKRSIEKNFVDIHNKVISYDDEQIDDSTHLSKNSRTSYVIDDEGKMHQSFDISDLKKTRSRKK